jgi:hypothetical protein
MKRLKSVLGTLWAAAALPLVVVLFLGFGRWPGLLVAATGLEVAPRWTGGEVAASTPRDTFTIQVHRPVFDALIGESSKGFVQVDIVPAGGDALPARVVETVTPAANPALAFRLLLEPATRGAIVEPIGDAVIGLRGAYQLDRGMAVRVNLRNPG